jgi:glycerophosphoryl diester phosphodiesterase
LLQAVALGVDAVEFDVHLSRDGQLMVMHDPTLDRTTEERGPLANRTAAELRRIDAGYWFTTDGGRTYPWRGRGATVPSFDEVVESLPRALPLIVELKTPAATEAIRAAIHRHALAPRVIVAGFSAQSVRPLRGEGFAIGASTGDVVRALPRALIGRQVTPSCDAFCIPPSHNGIPVPIRAIVNALRASRTVVHVWTINDRRQALRLWQAGVNGIISDDPGVMLDERQSFERSR